WAVILHPGLKRTSFRHSSTAAPPGRRVLSWSFNALRAGTASKSHRIPSNPARPERTSAIFIVDNFHALRSDSSMKKGQPLHAEYVSLIFLSPTKRAQDQQVRPVAVTWGPKAYEIGRAHV